ncbi:MAG: maleylpyruvate isomerase N-terminal domain-containing protein [Actinomycetota bacterium]
MSENLRAFTEAVYAFDAVVNRMPDEGWDAQSACEEWDGRQLLMHQCTVLNGVTIMARTGEMARPTPPEGGADDPVGTWRTTRNEVLEALDRKGALQQPGPFWFDAPTIDDLIGIVTWDPMTHTWDLSRCADLHHGLNPALVERVMAIIEPMQEMLSSSGRTAAATAAAEGADVIERYLRLVGRTP